MKTIKELKPGDRVYILRTIKNIGFYEAIVKENNTELSRLLLLKMDVNGILAETPFVMRYIDNQDKNECSSILAGTLYIDKQKMKTKYLQVLREQEENYKAELEKIQNERTRIFSL